MIGIALWWEKPGLNKATLTKLLDSALHELSPGAFMKVLEHLRKKLPYDASPGATNLIDATVEAYTLKCVAQINAARVAAPPAYASDKEGVPSAPSAALVTSPEPTKQC